MSSEIVVNLYLKRIHSARCALAPRGVVGVSHEAADECIPPFTYFSMHND